MIEKINANGTEYAIIIRREYESSGISFFTPDEYSQQLGYMKREAGYIIPRHFHKRNLREITYTLEVLFIKSGRVLATFYNDLQEDVASCQLHKGDVIMLVNGGHGFEFLEESEVIEVKQGPYSGIDDKVRF